MSGVGLTALLSELEQTLTQAGARVAILFSPGIDESEIRRQLQNTELTPTSELITWFGWHDGADISRLPSEYSEIVPGGEFRDLRYLTEQYRVMRSTAIAVAQDSEGSLTADDLWNKQWCPLLRLFGKGFAAADTSDSHGLTSAVHLVWHDSEPSMRARPVWPSVRDFVEFVIRQFDSGQYSVNNAGLVTGPTIDHSTV